jgi:CheY-like chemotaxis protein
LRLLPSVQPDLVILDDSLPDMNGWQVCHCIQLNPMSRHIRARSMRDGLYSETVPSRRSPGPR